MKIADKGPVDVNVSQLVRGEPAVSPVRDKGGKREVERSGEAAQVSISPEARRLQQVAALAEQGDELRAETVRQLKEQIAGGTYHVEAADVAKGVVRSEISQLLGQG
ncbi:MAG: flagellar biosynthesis anti-sigma factor FlgM [Deltaproteobacteria bacterium]|nr:flagellar biosynthesis anti-sigma factor FlgM [Deltaproteobacteria bacterium]